MFDQSLGYQLKRVQQALRNRMDDVLHQYNLTTPQYSTLSVLEEMPGASGADLARSSFVTAQTMNQIITNLEKSRLLTRRAHPIHGRVLQAFLTDEGRRVLKLCHSRVNQIEKEMLLDLSDEQQQAMLAGLEKMAERLEGHTLATTMQREPS